MRSIHQSNADSSTSRKNSTRSCFPIAWHIWAVLCSSVNKFIMALVSGRESEGSGRLLLFSYSSDSWCVLQCLHRGLTAQPRCICRAILLLQLINLSIWKKTLKRKIPAESIDDQEVTHSSCDAHYKNDYSDCVMGMGWDIHCGKGTRNILHCHLLWSKQEVKGALSNFAEEAASLEEEIVQNAKREEARRQSNQITFKLRLLLIVFRRYIHHQQCKGRRAVYMFTGCSVLLGKGNPFSPKRKIRIEEKV